MKPCKTMLLIFVIFPVLLQAQDQDQAPGVATVFGKVVSNQNGVPLSFVSVNVTRAQASTNPIGTLSDENGYFEIAGLPTGTFSISLSLSGYETASTNVLVFAGNANYDLGTLDLNAVSRALEEITVTGQQTDAAPSLDTRIYNLDNNIAQSTGSLSDVLRTLPGITVEQDGRVQLRGSDRVVILIDGKQSSLTGFGNQAGLDSIPAAGIASVEIINNPSAQFDASGMAGVINITYKTDDSRGLTGDVGLSYGVGQLSKRKDDLPTDLGSFSNNPKIIPSANLSYNTGSHRYFLNAQVLLQDDLPNNEFTTRFYDGRVTYSQVPENREQIQGIVNFGMDWNIDEDNLLTLAAVMDYESHQDNAQVPYINGSDGQRYRFWFWREEEDTGFLNLMSNFEHKFQEPGHSLSGSAQYTVGREDEDYFLNDRSALRNASDATHLKATEYTLPLQIDYVKPLSKGRLETGAKYQKRWIPVTYDVERGMDSIIYEGLGDKSEWGEQIWSAYGNLVYETFRFGVEGGLRFEKTEVYYDLPAENIYYPGSDSYDYFKVYPNFRFSYTLNDSSKLALYITNRVDRPGEAELRIFPKYDDPELLKVGNPYLRPQFTRNIELAWEQLWDTGSLIFSIYQRDIEDPFIRVFDIDYSNPEYNIVNRIYQNVGSASNEGFEIIATQDVTDYWSFSGSINWFENEVDRYETTLLFPAPRPFIVNQSSADTWNLNLNNQINLPYDIRMQLSYTYYAERNFSQGKEAARSSLDIGLTKAAFNNRGEVVLTVTDMLNKFGIRQDIDGNGFKAIYENYFESQVVSFGLRYNI